MKSKKPILMLAPLAGYTNIAYRTFMKKFGFDIVVSEMISDFALFYQNKETEKMIGVNDIERPVAIQLFGGDKESMLRGLYELQKKSDYDYLDINLGCPVVKVVKNNSGSSWLKKERQEELYDMISAVVKESIKPVTCKIRLGWSEEEITVLETCKILEKAGVSLITIHGRTRSQMYSGFANYEWIKKAKEIVSIPVIANGDITTLDKAIEVLEYTKCDGIAIGRGCLGNPRLIKQISEYYKTGIRLPDATKEEQVTYLKEHYKALLELKGEYIATQEIRGIAPHYFKGFTHVKQYKVELSQVKTKENLELVLEKILNDERIQKVEE